MTASGARGAVASRPPAHAARVVALLLAAAGVLVVVVRPVAPALPDVATGLDQLPAATRAAIEAYVTPRRAVGTATWLVATLAPLALLAIPAVRRGLSRLSRWTAAARRWRVPVAGIVIAGVTALVVELVWLPTRAWAGLVHDGAWQVRTASAGLWWRDRLLAVLVAVVVAGLVGAGGAILVRARPRSWPWHAVWVATIGAALLTIVWPLVVSPLFLPTEPLDDGDVATAVREIADRAGLDGLPVVVADASSRSERVNARVVGLGPSREIVLYDTLLDRPLDEVRVVVAHELAHQRHRDVERAVLATAPAVLVLGLLVRGVWRRPGVRRWLGADRGAAGDGDVRLVAVGVVVLSLVAVVGEPVGYWQSRRAEAAADAATIELGAAPGDVVRLNRRLAIDNLSPMERATWRTLLFATHPSPGERVRAAVARAVARDAPLPDVEALEAEEAADPPAWTRPD